MDLFVCQTAYQLLNAISIVKMRKIEADVLLFDRRLSNACDITELRKASIFHNVFEYYDFLDSVSDVYSTSFVKKVVNTFKKIKIYPKSLEFIQKTPNANIEYNRIFISYVDIPNAAVFFYHKKHHNSKLEVYDDGTYTYDCLSEKQSIVKTRLSNKTFGGIALDYCEHLWVRKPDSVDKGHYQEMPLVKIEYPFKKDELNHILSIFKTDYSEIDSLCRKIIILDQPYKNQRVNKRQIELATSLSERYGRKNVIVKIHPSYKEMAYSDSVDTYSGKLPFEVLINLFAIEKSVLVSIFSTACFTPKQVSNKEPLVVFTFKAVSLKRDGRDFNQKMALKYINRLQTNYSNPNLVAVPDNIDNLFQIIDARINPIQ